MPQYPNSAPISQTIYYSQISGVTLSNGGLIWAYGQKLGIFLSLFIKLIIIYLTYHYLFNLVKKKQLTNLRKGHVRTHLLIVNLGSLGGLFPNYKQIIMGT